MVEEPRFETRIAWPASPTQAMPPDPSFSRDCWLRAANHPDMPGALPTVFGGHDRGYNPEELLLLSLSECHMLTYLRMAAKEGIAVRGYDDHAVGRVGKGPSGMTQMAEVTLHPRVAVARGTDLAAARALHDRAHRACFMANSMNFPVLYEPEIVEE